MFKWYTGVVAAHHPQRGSFIKYHDGDRKWHNFALMERGSDYHILHTDHTDHTNVSCQMLTTNDLKCSICMELFRVPKTIMECMHTFCDSCLTSSLAAMNNKRCPLCNTPMCSMRDTRINPTISALVDKFTVNQPTVPIAKTIVKKTVMQKNDDHKQFRCKTCNKLKKAKCHPCGKSCGEVSGNVSQPE